MIVAVVALAWVTVAAVVGTALGRAASGPRPCPRPITAEERELPLYDLIAHRELQPFFEAWSALVEADRA